jgi:hypothetical protein
MKFPLLTLIFIVLSASALAQAPIEGVYTSTDLGGSILTGRYGTSWSHPTGYATPGNTLHIQSWDGSTLSGQWSFRCPILNTGRTISDSIDAEGIHHAVGEAEYTPCTLILDGSGPWGGGDPSYSFEVSDFREIVNIISTDTEILEIDYRATGHGIMVTDTYYATIYLYSMFRYEVDNTDNESHPPADFPEFLKPDCATVSQLGVWGNATEIHFKIMSSVPTEPSTWGRIKSIYGTTE